MNNWNKYEQYCRQIWETTHPARRRIMTDWKKFEQYCRQIWEATRPARRWITRKIGEEIAWEGVKWFVRKVLDFVWVFWDTAFA